MFHATTKTGNGTFDAQRSDPRIAQQIASPRIAEFAESLVGTDEIELAAGADPDVDVFSLLDIDADQVIASVRSPRGMVVLAVIIVGVIVAIMAMARRKRG